MASLYLLTALVCAAIAWQPYRRTAIWDWIDKNRDEIARIIMGLALLAAVYLFSHQ